MKKLLLAGVFGLALIGCGQKDESIKLSVEMCDCADHCCDCVDCDCDGCGPDEVCPCPDKKPEPVK
jgi:hypothetical protein